jgi:hypothetical protein
VSIRNIDIAIRPDPKLFMYFVYCVSGDAFGLDTMTVPNVQGASR